LTFSNGVKLWRIRKQQSLAAPPWISSPRQIVQEPILDMIDSLQNQGLLSGSYLCCRSSCNSYINFVLVGHVNNEICEQVNFAAQFTPLLLFCLQCIVFWEYCLSKNKKLVRTSSGLAYWWQLKFVVLISFLLQRQEKENLMWWINWCKYPWKCGKWDSKV
jgi:hypothetical protein